MAPKDTGFNAVKIDPTSGRWSAIIACVLLVASTCAALGSFAVGFTQVHGNRCGFMTFRHMNNQTCLEGFWEMQEPRRNWQLAHDVTDTLASFALVPPIVCLNHLFLRHGRKSQVLVGLMFTAAVMRLVEFCFNAGLQTYADFAAMAYSDPRANPMALRDLTIAYFTAQAQGMWTFSLDTLLLGIAFAVAARLSQVTETMPRCWIITSYVGTGFAVLHFLFALGTVSWVPAIQGIAFVCLLIVTIIILPIWMGILACRIPDAIRKSESLLGGAEL